MEEQTAQAPALGGLLTMALTDPKLKGLVGNIGVDSLHVTGIDQVRSWATGALARQVPVLLVTATSHEAEDLTAELQAMLGKGKVANFPAFETLPHERLSPAPDVVGARAKVLWEMPQVIVASARAFCHAVLPAGAPITVQLATEGDFAEEGTVLRGEGSAVVGDIHTRPEGDGLSRLNGVSSSGAHTTSAEGGG